MIKGFYKLSIVDFVEITQTRRRRAAAEQLGAMMMADTKGTAADPNHQGQKIRS